MYEDSLGRSHPRVGETLKNLAVLRYSKINLYSSQSEKISMLVAEDVFSHCIFLHLIISIWSVLLICKQLRRG